MGLGSLHDALQSGGVKWLAVTLLDICMVKDGWINCVNYLDNVELPIVLGSGSHCACCVSMVRVSHRDDIVAGSVQPGHHQRQLVCFCARVCEEDNLQVRQIKYSENFMIDQVLFDRAKVVISIW